LSNSSTTNYNRDQNPRAKKEPGTINTTSHSTDWSSGLSPFKLGPIALYGSYTARIFENAWQFAKLYPEHADTNGEPTSRYWTWPQNGWNSNTAFRYPAGKGRKPLCSLWNGHRLNYIEARKQIYIPLYQAAVKRTSAYRTLERLYLERGRLSLFDYDGYDHYELGMSLKDVINCPTRICGHALVLAMMLMYGSEFRVDDLPAVDHTSRTSGRRTASYSIQIVNRNTFNGNSEYVGRAMRALAESPLGNKIQRATSWSLHKGRIGTHLISRMALERNAKQAESRLHRTASLDQNSKKPGPHFILLVRSRTLPRDDKLKTRSNFSSRTKDDTRSALARATRGENIPAKKRQPARPISFGLHTASPSA
jgi:hypothetical protein